MSVEMRSNVPTSANAQSVNVNVNKPSDAAQGDTIFAFIVSNGDVDEFFTPPDGTWTEVAQRMSTVGGGQTVGVFFKVAGGSEPSSYTFTQSVSHTSVTSSIALYDTENRPLGVHGVASGDNATGPTHTSSAIQATAGDNVFSLFGNDQPIATIGDFEPSSPAELTVIADAWETSQYVGLGLFREVRASTGSAPHVVTQNAGGDNTRGTGFIIFSVRPASANQITHARVFNGTSDEIQLDPADFAGQTMGPFTVAAIARRGSGTAFYWAWSVEGGGGGELAFGRSATYSLGIWNGVEGVPSDAADMYTEADGWSLIAVTKETGSVVPRFHRYRYSDSTWTHDDTVTASANVTFGATPQMWLGTYEGASEFWLGDIACVGVWRTAALSDGNLEGMVNDIDSWEALSPTGLWLLDQSSVATPVTDRVGAGDQIAINGTTSLAITDLPFDVGGASQATSIFLPVSRRG